MNEDRFYDVADALDHAATALDDTNPDAAAGINEAASRLRDVVEDTAVDELVARIKDLRKTQNDCIESKYFDIADDTQREINSLLQAPELSEIDEAEQLPGVDERLDEREFY